MEHDDTPPESSIDPSTESTDNYRTETGDRDEKQSNKLQSTWTDNGLSQSRRELLKQVSGIGVTSIVGFSGVAAAQKESTKKLDTDFDPEDKKQVKRFLERLRTIPEKKQRGLSDQLSKPQQRAINKGLTPTRQTIERIDTQPQASDDTVQAQAVPATAHFVVTAETVVGNVAYKFHQKVSWNHVPPSPNYPGNVSNITANAYPTEEDMFHEYKGITSDSQRDNGASFTSFMQGKFRNFIPATDYEAFFHPYIDITGFSDGFATATKDRG